MVEPCILVFYSVPAQNAPKTEILPKSAVSNNSLSTSTILIASSSNLIPKKTEIKPSANPSHKSKVIVSEPVIEPLVKELPKVSAECENWNKLSEELKQKEAEFQNWKKEVFEPKRLQMIENADKEYDACVATLASGEKFGRCSLPRMHASSDFLAEWETIINEKQDPIKKLKKTLKKTDSCKSQ